MKKINIFICLIMFILGLGFSIEDARLLRYPDVNNKQIAFVYAGDIWTVTTEGGEAKRLTSHEGFELFPKISPDGKWIAFSGEYSKNRQIFIIPTRGGVPKQLTFYNDVGVMPPRGGYDYIPLDWSADSKKILVRINRTPYGKRMGKYFWVNLEGGLETPLQIPEAGFGTLSPDDKKITYTPISREFRTWKRTKGGRAQDVWTYDLQANTSKRITKFPGTDQHPIWFKDKIIFVSDRNLTLNFWSFDLKSEKLKQITNYSDYDVLWPSGHDEKLAFEKGGFIHVLDLNTEKTKKITIEINFDNPNKISYFKNVSRFSSRFGASISPKGERVIFDARGDLFSVPAKEGVTVNLTKSQGIREMYPVWSPDGKWIAYISDVTGNYEIYIKNPQNTKIIQMTKNHKIWKYPPTWSPDSKKIAFNDNSRKLSVIDIKSKSTSTIDKGYLNDIRDYNWSFDSKWIVYTKNGKNKVTSLWLYSFDSKKTNKISSDKYNDSGAVFSKCSKYIFFTSDRDFSMLGGFSDMEFDYVFKNTERIFAMALTKDAPPLFNEKNDLKKDPSKTTDKKKEKNKKEKKKKEKKTKPMSIDFDGISSRVSVFPFRPGNYGIFADTGGKLLYLVNGELKQYDIKTKKNKSIISGVAPVALSADNKKLLYRQGRKWGIANVQPGQKPGTGLLNLSGLVMKIDPVKEWKQIFNEGWRIYRDWFYVKNMHGVDWKKIRKKYSKLLEYVGHRADLDYIFGEMIGELNAGHCYVNWGDFKRPSRINGGLLGAVLEADFKVKRYKIKKIYKGENWNEATRSPLTEQGIDIKEGSYLLKINGQNLTTLENPYKYLENTALKKITITVNSKPGLEGAKTYWVKPISSESGLMYLDWVESRRQLVDKLSNGKIGYIHVPDTAVAGNRELFKGLYAYSAKSAFIIDDRYNGGGWSPGNMIEKLTQRPISFWHRRNLALRQEPAYAFNGPMVMLINHYSSSGGDNFPYWFKKRNLGPLIGTRTWGGLIGYGWSPGLVDGPSFAVPMSGITSTQGELIVEGVGIYPDPGFEVYDRPEEIAKGHDPSLEKAVKHLLGELKKNPSKTPKPPAEPNRSKWFEKEIK